MASMKHVWFVTVVGCLGGAALLGTYMATSGNDLRSGKVLGDSGIGLWMLLTNEGHTKWLPWLAGALFGGIICFVAARASYRNRQWHEARDAEAAAVPHPMD